MIDFQAAIFDLDGTLVDSMWIWDRLLVDFLAERGYETPQHILNQVAYMTLKQSSAFIQKEYRLSMTPEEVCSTWTEMVYAYYAHQVRSKPGAPEYLRYLKQNGVKIGVATACTPALCEAALSSNRMLDLIDCFTYADEVGKGKESPDVYLECIRRLNVRPDETMIYEDILTAVRSAKKAGLRVTAIEDASAKSERERIRQEADLYIADFFALLPGGRNTDGEKCR